MDRLRELTNRLFTVDVAEETIRAGLNHRLNHTRYNWQMYIQARTAEHETAEGAVPGQT